MKKTLCLGAAAFALLFALTGCTGTRNTNRTMTADQSYTADQRGRTNEAGDNGVITGSNSSATNGTDKSRVDTDRNNDGVPDRAQSRAATDNDGVVGTLQDGSSAAAHGVRRAVDRAGEVVDDVAYGAADIVDDATDVVTGEDNARRGTNNTVR